MNEPKQPAHDSVEAPSHYKTLGDTYEPINVIEAWESGFHIGNTIKYLARAGHKGSRLEDLKKARWYLDREITNTEKSNGKD